MDELMKFTPYEASIDFNPHKGIHETIEDYYDRDSFIDYDECIKQERVFCIRVYPRTSVGFYEVCASEYQTALKKMCDTLENDSK